MKELNEMQKKIYEYLAEQVQRGVPPTVREIGSAVGPHSPSSVARYVDILKREGRLVPLRSRKARAFGVSRSVELPIGEEQARRVQLEVADGGCVRVDCNVNYADGQPVSLTFSGILDATGLKGSVSQVIGCSASGLEE